MKKEDNFWIFVGLGFNVYDAAYLANGKHYWIYWGIYGE
jgi:hypothetical protein